MAESSSVSPTSTFVLRFWREWSGTAGRWRGRIEHVQSGQHVDFVDLAEALGFVQNLGVMVENQTTPYQADQ